jgi:hypothetical protein
MLGIFLPCQTLYGQYIPPSGCPAIAALTVMRSLSSTFQPLAAPPALSKVRIRLEEYVVGRFRFCYGSYPYGFLHI